MPRNKATALRRRLISTIKNQKLYDPRSFLSAGRIDLAAKTIFARAYLEGNTSNWPEIVYREHIRAFNNFYEEHPVKSSYEDFKSSFIDTIESVRSSDDWKHKSPVQYKNKHLINGAHRVAASIVLDDKINSVLLESGHEHKWGYDFFSSKRGDIAQIDQDVLDYMTIEYVSLKKRDIFAAIIFPTAEGHREDVFRHLSMLGEIVNMKSFKYDEFIGKEVIKQLYFDSKNDAWNYGNDFAGAINKAQGCFDGKGDLQVYIIEANLDESTRIREKQYLRDIWKKDKHSIHITDTVDEVNRVARMFFNENSRQFLKIDRQQEFYSQEMYDMFMEYTRLAPTDIVEREKVAIEGSAVLDLFNIRAGRDIDYISRDEAISFGNEDIEKHSLEENKYHTQTLDEILTNPTYYFYYKGYKIVDIVEMYHYKQNRKKSTHEAKDTEDIGSIEKFLESHPRS